MYLLRPLETLAAPRFEQGKTARARESLQKNAVLDLDPGCGFRRVPGARLLGDNSLHVPVADHAEQVRAVRDVLHIANRVRLPREQFPKQ